MANNTPGLKEDILSALEKNGAHDENVDGKVQEVLPPTEKGSKLEVLANDLANAIAKFLLAQDFKIDKLSAPVLQYDIKATPTAPIPSYPVIAPPTPMNLQGLVGAIIETTADVDVTGRAANGSLLGKDASDNSLVKLREVKKDTLSNANSR